jgi:hypothetical protein
MEYSAGGKKYTIPVATPNKAIRAVPPNVFVVITVLFWYRLFFKEWKGDPLDQNCDARED